jgi:hypothetical protein
MDGTTGGMNTPTDPTDQLSSSITLYIYIYITIY